MKTDFAVVQLFDAYISVKGVKTFEHGLPLQPHSCT